MQFPEYRARRLRKTEGLRRLVSETRLSVSDFVYPLFIVEGKNIRRPIASLPGIFQLSIDEALTEARLAYEMGIPAVILFGIPTQKDPTGFAAVVKDGIIQRTVNQLKKSLPQLVVVTDVCLCEYTSHGHCGILQGEGVANDETLDVLADIAVSHARAGADIVAPSAMMDGQVGAIREGLDENDFSEVPIMAYSAKYASAFYGPFREAAQSAPQKGDRQSYQMNYANSDEAMREICLDVDEGADIIMVKPALAYLDIVRRAKEEFDLPLAAYNVSGEYAMLKAAAAKGWLDNDRAILEMLTAIKRAGADIIITYFAMEATKLLKKG
ncbi:MAG: porphobilinogen synthase [Deltaproteobacteria bacterium]|nr:porphobilinogen synthase [Deltaproteobacteria bacterium]